MPVPILKLGPFLIATVQAALTDSDTERLRHDLMERVSRFRARGIIIDLTAIATCWIPTSPDRCRPSRT